MPRDGSIVPLFGTSTEGLSPVVTAQRRVNLYVHQNDDKGGIALYPRPGLAQFGRPSSVGAPCRGLLDGDFQRYLVLPAIYEIVGCGIWGNQFVEYQSGYGAFVPIASVLTSTGRCEFARNPTQVLAVDGRTGYIYDPPAQSITTLEGLGTAAWFPAGATSCTFLAGRFYVNEPRTGRVWYSDLNDGLTGAGTNFITAEADPDDVVSVMADHGELVIFGAYTTEFWAPQGGSGDPVARVGGSAAEWGLASPGSLRKTDGGVMFLGRNRLGDIRVLVARGYQAQPVSTPDVETVIQRMPDIGSATAMAFTANGHSFYILSFGSKSLVYDMTTGTWGEWSTGVDGERWIGQYGTLVSGRYLVTDYRVSEVYTMEPDAYADGSETIARDVVTKHTFADYDRTTVDKLGVDFETGVGLVGEDAPQAMLQVSRDNGRTWGNEVWASLGAIGEYSKRVWWRLGGRGRDWLFRIRVTDPVKVVIAGGSLKVRP